MNEDVLREFLGKIDGVFFWLRVIYPRMTAYPGYVLFLYFIFQKLIPLSFFVPWPVHRTSRVLSAHKIIRGENSAPGMSPGNYIQAKNGIQLGSNVLVGPGVGLISANHSKSDRFQWEPCDPIVIGDNVWIGMNAVVLPGIHIGKNAIIGAGCIVSKNVPENALALGNPCRIVMKK